MARKFTSTKSSSATTDKGLSWAKPAGSEDKRSLIAKKAYELFVKRGYKHGNDQNDWYEAEKIVTRQSR